MKDHSLQKKKRKMKGIPEFRAADMTEQQIKEQAELRKQQVNTCPTDPAELAQCDSCQ